MDRFGTATRAPLLALLFVTAAGGGCTAITVANMVLDAETSVSVTVHGDEQQLQIAIAGLRQFDQVQTVVRIVRVGERVLEVVGTYAAVIEALGLLVDTGLELVANDGVTATILEAAVLLLK